MRILDPAPDDVPSLEAATYAVVRESTSCFFDSMPFGVLGVFLDAFDTAVDYAIELSIVESSFLLLVRKS